MRKTKLFCLVALIASWATPCFPAGEAVRRLPVAEYRDKMKAGWIGQMAGVAWGAPTEFRWRDKIMPAEAMPRWTPGLINSAFNQDDLYVEMTFLRSLEQYGLDVSIRQAGIDFANSRYRLWCANAAGRNNLRAGIAPPDSSHPRFSRCPNDIDYQIEADYSGLIAPGLPNAAVRLGEKFGRLMNYGDGVYGGQFMGALYSEAFFQSDPVKLAEAALRHIPEQSQYAEMVRDMLRWHREDPADWEKTWQKAQAKYRKDPEYQRASNGGIDVKINGAYVLMGLLFGKGDLDQTIIISCRSGQDSDCNPSSAAGVLFTTVGFAQLPKRFTGELDETAVFSHTAYDFPRLVAVCEQLARKMIAAAGGRVERGADGGDVFVIPVEAPRPSTLELSWAPGPIADSRFTADEMAQIKAGLKYELEEFAPGWKISNCGREMNPGLQDKWNNKKKVFVTHPLDRTTPCTLAKSVDVPANKKTLLRLVVGHHARGDWKLVVKADGQELLSKPVGKTTARDGWMSVTIDLTPWAGKAVALELANAPTGWSNEAGYWATIAVESR